MLENKVVIITGAAGGIGVATARMLAKAGAKLVLADIGAAGAALAKELAEQGAECMFVETDVSSEPAVANMVSVAVSTFGRLDGAFNNAGIEYRGVPLHQLSLEDWNKVISVDLSAVFLCMKHEIAAMLETGGGAIVNTSSALGVITWLHSSEYVAAKHGVIGLTKSAALDYGGQNIRVNAILPGTILTPMVERANSDPAMTTNLKKLMDHHPIERFGEPREIGEAVKWLLSDASSFVTGASIPVDGGFLAV